MNSELFSTIGYISVLLWLAMALLWLVHWALRRRPWHCHLALWLGIAALLCAKINSVTYVHRLQIDRSEQLAAARARQEAARKKAEEERADDVAQIRFAEDDADDYLDLAGMGDADRKYLESFGGDEVPAWKREKGQRAAGRTEDDSVEGLLNADTDAEVTDQGGMDGEGLGAEAKPAAVASLPESQVVLAHRLDRLNRHTVLWLLLIGVVLLVYDYLRCLNIYRDAYFPLPVPSPLVNAVKSLPAIASRPAKPRRSMPDELKWLARRGDAFLYLAADADAANAVPETMSRCPVAKRKHTVDIIRLSDADTHTDDDFVFESLWYNRACFVVDSKERSDALLRHIARRLSERLHTRARARQTVHIVRGQGVPVAEDVRRELPDSLAETGWTLLDDQRGEAT